MAVKKFLKFDSEKGYLDNKDDINYFATNQMRRVAFGGMLGNFDENGFYVINQKVVDELIKMPKVIVDMADGADLIRSKIKFDCFYHFILTVEENKATFSLLEKLQYQSNRNFNSGAYSDINEYVIDEMYIADKDFDRNVLYEKYNISVDRDENALSIFDMDEETRALYYNIIEKIKVNYLVKNELILKEKEIEGIESDYFEGVLAALQEFPELDKKVKAELKQELGEKYNFVIINKPFFQKTVNEILDSCIDLYIQDLSPEQREEFLNRFRLVKAAFYAKFKELVHIEIKQSAGVRFNPEQVQEESIIGTLSKEIVTKGYTASDIRRVVINDSELQLTLEKIKEMVEENEKLCTKDNANATLITKGRKLTKEFYTDLANESVNVLQKDKLIKTAIVENAAETKTAAEKGKSASTEAGKTVGSSSGGVTKAGGGTTKGGGGTTKGGAGKGGTTAPKNTKKGGTAQSGTGGKSTTKTTKKSEAASTSGSYWYTGWSTASATQNRKEAEISDAERLLKENAKRTNVQGERIELDNHKSTGFEIDL